jgi:hypothetical protein
MNPQAMTPQWRVIYFDVLRPAQKRAGIPVRLATARREPRISARRTTHRTTRTRVRGPDDPARPHDPLAVPTIERGR